MNPKYNIYRLSASLVFIAVTLWQVYSIYTNCDGNYIYPLDDTYIHLSIADNFSQNGIWGVTEHEFSSSSSSIFYTLLLAGLNYLFGQNELLPLLINIIISYLLMMYLFKILLPDFVIITNIEEKNYIGFIWKGFLAGFITLLISICAPLIILSLSGMEHTFQIFINLIFINVFIRYMNSSNNKDFNKLLILGVFVSTIRFEGLFIILLSFILLVVKKEYIRALTLTFISIIPLVIYGFISIGEGSLFFPNSILLKSSKPVTMDLWGILTYPFSWISKMIDEPHLLTIFISSIALLYVNLKSHRSLTTKKSLWLILSLSLIIIHLTFARTGWVYRYEAYLVVLGLTALALNIIDIWKFGETQIRNATIVLTVILLLSNGMRAFQSINDVSTMSRNIYEQQYQMSRFLKESYNNDAIVLGDIGACTYFTNIKLFDIVGLGSIEPVKLRINKSFDKTAIKKIANEKQCKIAIIYKDAFVDYIPETWIEAGTWTIKNNLGCYMDKVTFYAINDYDYLELLANLDAFKSKLPTSVIVE